MLALLAWRAPRRAGGREAGASAGGAAEAAALGVTGLGALTSYGRLLLADRTEPAGRRRPARACARTTARAARTRLVAALDALLPAPVDHLLVQADLTVVVPGPPEPALAAELALVADPESAGGATRLPGHRRTSVRRALDAGYAADDLHALFARRSRTPVPQALTYLIDDVARRHGGLRVGTAGAYLRSDDEALLAEVLADRRLAALALRRLAPTVLVTPYPAGRLLSALREAGYAPVPEDASGAAVLTRPKVRRAAARARSPRGPTGRLAGGPARPTRAATTPAARHHRTDPARGGGGPGRAPRAGHRPRRPTGTARPAAPRRRPTPRHSPSCNRRYGSKARVWVGYVDAHGTAASRLVRPVSIGAGYLRAEDERTEILHTFALHRITAAVLEE